MNYPEEPIAEHIEGLPILKAQMSDDEVAQRWAELQDLRAGDLEKWIEANKQTLLEGFAEENYAQFSDHCHEEFDLKPNATLAENRWIDLNQKELRRLFAEKEEGEFRDYAVRRYLELHPGV